MIPSIDNLNKLNNASEAVGYLQACEHISNEASALSWSSGIPFLFSWLLCRRVMSLIRAAHQGCSVPRHNLSEKIRSRTLVTGRDGL